MRGPTARFYFAPGYTWTTADASIAWVEFTDKVFLQMGASANRGRGSERDEFQAGSCSFTLDNRGRLFDPSYTAGTYYGDLKPGVPVKIEAEVTETWLLDEDGQPILDENGHEILLETPVTTTYPVFRGYIEGFPQRYPDTSDSVITVPISAVDGFGKLAQAGLPSSVYALEVAADSPQIWWRCAEQSGPTVSDSSSNGFDGTFQDSAVRLATATHPNPWESITAIEADGGQKFRSSDSAARITDDPYTLEAIVTVGDLTDTTQRDILRQSDADAGVFWSVGVLGFGGTNYRWIIRSHMAGEVTDAQWNSANIDISTLSAEPFWHIVVRRNGGTHTLYLNGTAQTLSSAGGDTNANKTYEVSGLGGNGEWIGLGADLAVYATDIGTTRIADHYEALTAPWDGDTTGERIARILDLVGWPSDLRSVATGLTILGPATFGAKALQIIRGYEKAEQGRFFISRDGKVTFLDRYDFLNGGGATVQATFSDDGADIPYRGMSFDFGAKQVFNRIRGSRTGGSMVEVFDQTSIDAYGEQVDTNLENIQVGTDAEVRALCEARLSRYKDPQLRLEPLQVALHGLTATQQAAVLGLELGERVNVERTPNDTGSAIDQDAIVEGVSHAIGPGQWTVTITTSPADNVGYGVWDTGLWDTAVWA